MSGIWVVREVRNSGRIAWMRVRARTVMAVVVRMGRMDERLSMLAGWQVERGS